MSKTFVIYELFLIIVNFLILKRTQMYKNLLNCNCKRTITLQITKIVHIGENIPQVAVVMESTSDCPA